MSYAAIVGVFTEIPILCEYAFSILVGAFYLARRSPPVQEAFQAVAYDIHRTNFGCDCGGLRRNPNSQQLRLLGYGGQLSHCHCRHPLAISDHLRRAWFNVDRIWAISLLLTAGITLFVSA